MLDRRNLFFVDAFGPPPGTDCWHEGPSLIEAVRGVTAAEAIWKPATKSHCIWELVLHCAYWKFVVRRFFEQEEAGAFPRSPQDWPKAPKPSDEQAWAKDRALWRDEHRRLREAIAKLPPKRWDLIPPGGKESTYAQLVVGITCHDAHHTGQIQLLKRLARTKKIKSRPSA